MLAYNTPLARVADRVALPPPGLHLLDASMFWGAAGGVRRVLTTKHRLLPELGWRHTVLAPDAQGPGCIDCGGMTLPASGGYRVVLRRHAAERLIEAAHPDIIEAADPYTLAWSVLGAARRLGVPSVAFCHINLPALAARWVGGRGGLGTAHGRWAARRARDYLVGLYQRFDLVLAPSQGLAEQLRTWGLSQVRVQPLGVDCTVFSPVAADAAWRVRLCEHLGLRPFTRLLVYTGRYAPEKNLQVLADAVQRLGPGHALLTVGHGPQPPRGSQVIVLPPQTDSAMLARLLASADVYVHAGDQETFGLGVLEAMACGTPVVVSAAGALGELAYGAGVLVQRQGAEEWAEAMQAALDAGARSPLVQVALERANELAWPQILEQLTGHYLQLVRRGPAHSPAPDYSTASDGTRERLHLAQFTGRGR
jgi:alpha-1,6-mannosyltransferase